MKAGQNRYDIIKTSAVVQFGPESELRIWRFIFENEYIFDCFIFMDGFGSILHCNVKRLCK